MKEAGGKLRQSVPFLVFFLLVFLFHLLFVRLLPKTDDGGFLGVVADPAFTYAGWLRSRYLTVSGRTAGEFLLAFFLKRPLVFWKLFNSLAITYVARFWVRLSRLVSEKNAAEASTLFCFCGLFTVAVSCLNPSVFWFSGSFSYLWPFAGLLAVTEPLIVCYFTGRVKWIGVLLSLPFVPLATMQEQSALCCAALSVLLIPAAVLKWKQIIIPTLLPLGPIALCCYHLFSSPGIGGRTAMETTSAFEAYAAFRAPEKLFCGVSNFLANACFFGLFLPLLFSALVWLRIRQTEPPRAMKKACRFCGALEGLGMLCVFISAACAKTLPHMLARAAFQSGRFPVAFWLAFTGGCLVIAAVFSLVIMLAIREKTIGLPVGVCAAAAFCAAIVMGFSPTVFASGQRVFFFTNAFLFTACATLFASLRESKAKTAALKATVVYACATFCLNCAAFSLLEHPLMG